jgi:hypothetical protein
VRDKSVPLGMRAQCRFGSINLVAGGPFTQVM